MTSTFPCAAMASRCWLVNEASSGVIGLPGAKVAVGVLPRIDPTNASVFAPVASRCFACLIRVDSDPTLQERTPEIADLFLNGIQHALKICSLHRPLAPGGDISVLFAGVFELVSFFGLPAIESLERSDIKQTTVLKCRHREQG